MSLINPADPIEVQNEKLLRIAESLMRHVEHNSAQSGEAYAQFERAALLAHPLRWSGDQSGGGTNASGSRSSDASRSGRLLSVRTPSRNS